MAQEHRFQINMRGIIDLLAHHLYSGPEVFMRELLQNGVDALTARQRLGQSFDGRVRMEIVAPAGAGATPTLIFEDNGIGLTFAEVETFLSTIGLSSKREDLAQQRSEFLGQFGIGLLSCFMVSEEIVMVTRSARPGNPALEWRGRPDGTYTVDQLDRDLAPGTRVFLRARPDTAPLFTAERVAELAAHFGSLLHQPIFLEGPKGPRRINATQPPWRMSYRNAEEQRQAFLDYGQDLFETNFLDAFTLRAESGGVEGIAWVLPYAPSLAARGKHRVYLKGMLISEAVENLMPEWAFFVRGVLDSSKLRPTASRESFYEDEAFAQTRGELAEALRDYLCTVARTDPNRLKRLIMLHFLSIKALAVEDEEFFKLFIDWLPFETSVGTLTLKEVAARSERIHFVRTRDQFKQVAQIAAAQNLCVVDGGYVYDSELLERYAQLREVDVEAVEPSSLTERLDDLTLQEREEAHAFLAAAEAALRPFRCNVEIRKFKPRELPALYSMDRDAAFHRSARQSKAISNTLWSSVLDGVAPPLENSGDFAQIVFNHANPLVAKLLAFEARPQRERAIQMLYVQALLQGHHPLHAEEMRILNKGLLDLITWSVEGQERGK